MNNHENNSYEQNIVDIIIPVYNSLTTLERALDSIRNLNNKDRIRIYIIDDFSDESYGSTINKYDDLDIMYYRLDDNKGPGYARNYGLNHSNGKYVIFLDSDDSFSDSESVNVLVDAIEENDADEVRSIFRLISDNEEIDFYNDNLGLHGKIYRRSFIEDSEVMFAKTRSFEDTFFNTMIYLKNGSIIDIDNVTYFWYENDDSLTNTSDLDEKINDYYSNIIKAINLCKDNGERERIIEIIIDSLYFVYNNDYIIDSYLYQLSKLLNDYNVNIDEWLNEYEIEDLVDFKEFIYKYLNINKRLINEFNASNLEEKNKKLKEQFASFGEDNIIETPINTNCGGINVSIGSGVYINFGLSLVDNGNIYIGDNTFIGPNVSILTLNHGISKKGREEGEIEIKDVKIGKNVWIGAGVIILPGVTIGDNSVIGAGSIVTKNVPKNSLAFGNPCKVIKKI